MFLFIMENQKRTCPKVFVSTESGNHYISNNPDTSVFEDDLSLLWSEVQYIQLNILKDTLWDKYSGTVTK